jgi:8-oxo-dGTP pyrophosphatase MutT (NUDIX family)
VIEAAGGVVWRTDDAGRPVLLVVHRPRYDDWSLPKGKLDPGEAVEDAALREVLEETGLACRLGREAAEVRYVDRNGHRKRVRYWHMELVEPLTLAFTPNDEVDELRWLPIEEAAALLTYERDVAVVRELERPSSE